jgi:hypothetical protein
MGLYRLCLGKTADGKTGYTLLLPTLASLLSFLEDALSIKPMKNLEVCLCMTSSPAKSTDMCSKIYRHML